MNEWVLVEVDDIPEQGGKGLELATPGGEGRSIFIVRKEGKLYAYLNRCPHTGVGLEWMPNEFFDYDRNYIQCAMHGALFAVEDGLCLRGPCIGQHLQPLALEVRREGCFVNIGA
ncbi:MAG TPA: Rieske (2Fe-2S) protein [Chromatiaceae bacterium]|nr:Rieske (2Fe-2S) protein [Chromatiaceae bacterium]